MFNTARIQELWDGDLKHYTINLLSASTGMRLGERQALQNQNVMSGYVRVWYSWGRKHGLKATKNREKRSVPIPAVTQSSLSELMAISPYKDPEDFLFWGIHGRKPIDQRTIADVLYEAFERVGISERQRVRRNISFHSWRHFFNTPISRLRISGASCRPRKIFLKVNDHENTGSDHMTLIEQYDREMQKQNGLEEKLATSRRWLRDAKQSLELQR